MKKITYLGHLRAAAIFGVKPRNPISFFFWKFFSKDNGEYDIFKEENNNENMEQTQG